MQVKRQPAWETLAAITALISGSLYSCRWIWEITEGMLKNKQYTPSVVTQYFFLVKLTMIITFLGLHQRMERLKEIQFGLLLACGGLAWTAITRTLEAHGAPGPWGFYSSPGLLLFIACSFIAGSGMANLKGLASLGKILKMISLFSFLGSFSSMLLFNLFGRDQLANQAASLIANIFLISEGICWMLLGRYLLLQRKLDFEFSYDVK